MQKALTTKPEKGGVAAPIIMWMAGGPLFLVVILWFLFFRH